MMSFAALTSEPLSEYMIGDEVEFNTQDIFNKYGFADGDLLQDLYYEYMQTTKGIDFKNPSNSALYGSRLNPSLLFQVVSELVLPQVTPQIDIEDVRTCHNPVRSNNEVDLEPAYIYVPVNKILLIFDRIYNAHQENAAIHPRC